MPAVTAVGMLLGTLVVVQPALSYATSPPRIEWGPFPEMALTVALLALVLALGGVVRFVGRRHAGVPAFGSGLLLSSVTGAIGAYVIFML